MDGKRKVLEKPSINCNAQSSNDTRTKHVLEANNERFRPKRAAMPMEEPSKCYLLRELTAERSSIEKGMLDVDRLILKLFTSGTLDFVSLNNITQYPIRNDRTQALLDHFLQINNNGILRQFVSHMRDPVILNAEALNWAEYMQGCSDSCCMFFIKKYADVFQYVLEEYSVKRFAEYFVKSGMLKESESNDLCKYNQKEGAERFMHILFTKKTILCVADMWFTLVQHQNDLPYLGPYINSFLKAFDEQTGPLCPQFDPELPIKPLLIKKCYVNVYRLLHLIHVEGTKAVRNIFDAHISPKELDEEVTKNKVLIKNRLEGTDFSNVRKRWMNIVYSTEKSKTLHFTLPLFHFLAVFMKKFPRPKKGWTGRLARSDTSPGAYLRRICEMRDYLLKGIFHTHLTYEKFDQIWNEAAEILVHLGIDDKRLQELRLQPMNVIFIDRRYMEKYFNKPLSQLLEELIVRHHNGIDSVCACSLAEDLCAGHETQKPGVKLVDTTEEHKEKETSEDEFAKPIPATGDSKSKKRRKKSRGKKSKKTEAAAQTTLQEAEMLKELKSPLSQNSEMPEEQNQELILEPEATGAAESCDINSRSEEEISQVKILDGKVDVCVNTDDVDLKETFKRIEEERNRLIHTLEDLRDSCKQIENESHLEIKAWKQKIHEKEKLCEGLQQEILSTKLQLQEESCKIIQEQKTHQMQLIKVKEQIRIKRSQFERCEKLINNKNEEIVKLKKELQNELEHWSREKLQLEEELAIAQQSETESVRKAVSQESLLLEMRRDFLLRNLEDALLETEHQLSMLADEMRRQIADPSQIQAAVNKWEAIAADLRSKIEYTKINFNDHIYLIKKGAKLSNLPMLSNPEPPTSLSLHILKSQRKASSQYLSEPQPSLQLHAATTTATTSTATSSILQGYRNRSELSSFVDQGQTEQKMWTRIENQKACKQLVQQQRIEEDPCIICHEELVPPKDCYKLECKHIFHKKCIDYWLKEQSTCPICRILVRKPEDYPQLSKK
ncbi:E3 ubiquitin-protein ligase DZIP3-like isoform X1 [Rhincodon typus]|uniref:E3 ubiquitin-protein ligase DZIP3-like isoform X1 n=1 Tax=Rhincodon typus TaxID=259920 RepID=UPI00202E4F50|nr:E3 ubiquitin-protein ligase DZIP3-like isoform X1 [Rhincodon typus]XP_048458938.1 E3 ubiquitin-protein ligase DZIP3-like isoform X1 [Rhincodon typus]